MTLNVGMWISKTKKEYIVISWQETGLLYLSLNVENHFQQNQVVKLNKIKKMKL